MERPTNASQRDPMRRVKLRPLASEWEDTEPVTLVEAIALLFPNGPLTVKSLRTAIHRSDLAAARVAGKDFTTLKAVREMMKPRRKHIATGPRSTSPLTQTAREPAQAAALKIVRELRESLRRK